jgi:hypothetical protein
MASFLFLIIISGLFAVTSLSVCCLIPQHCCYYYYYYYYYYSFSTVRKVFNSYNYMPEAYHVPRVYIVAVTLYLQFVQHLMLFPMINVCTLHQYFLQCVYSANMAVSCSTLISSFPVLGYFLKDCKMVPVAPIIASITFVVMLYVHVLYLYCKVF